MSDMVTESLMIAAETGDDISEAVYANYFARCPGSEALMSHIDHLVRGKMLEEVFRLIMLESYSDEQNYLNFEVKNHKLAYSVEPDMYGNLLSALHETVRSTVGDVWTNEMDAAWQARIADLTQEIRSRL